MNEREDLWARRFNVPVLIAALLVVPVLVIEQTRSSGGWRETARVLNWGIWLVFLAELLVLLTVTQRRRHWLARHPLELAIVLLTAPFLPASLQAARLFRLLRVMRLFRAIQVGRRLATLEGLRWAAVVAGMTALGGGAAFAAVEGRSISTWDGVYWALSTMTTVGYGDIAPHTDAGRVIAIVVMTVGVGFGGLFIAALAERFVATGAAVRVAEVESEIHISEDALLAQLAAVRTQLAAIESGLRARAAG